jgi:hypothetical protein
VPCPITRQRASTAASSQHHLEERATKLALFFIPVFTPSKSHRIACSNCGQTSMINSRQKKALAR